MKRREIEERTICLAITGSQAYGLATEDSDTDYKGIFVATKPYYLGFKTIEQKDSGWQDTNDPGLEDSVYAKLNNPKDMVVYELRKFLKLSIENNPNILEMLYFDSKLYLKRSLLFDEIVKHRDLILSKKVKYSLSGYAYNQLRRVETHRKWLLDPPTQPPKLEDFGLTDDSVLTKTELNAFIEFLYILIKDKIEWEIESEEMKALLDEIDFKGVLTHHPLAEELLPEVQKLTRSTNDFISLLHKTQLFRKEKKNWDAYQSWLKNRNKKRAELELKCGYDCYSADTEFLTNNGWKLFDDVKETDLLATFNIKTQQLEYQTPIKKFDNVIDVFDFVELEDKYTKTKVTNNHKLFVSKFTRKPSTNYSVEYTGNPFELVEASSVLSYGNFHVISALKPQKEDYPGVSDFYLKLMGLYVSEGCILKRKNSKSLTLRVEQKLGGKLIPLLEDMFVNNEYARWFSIKRPGRKNMPDYEGLLYTYSKKEDLEKLLAECGSGSYYKKLPSWTTLLSERQRNLILEAMLLADGTKKTSGWVLYTVSKDLADSYQAMCVCTGLPCQIWGPYELNYEGSFKKHSVYQVYTPDNFKVEKALSRKLHFKTETVYKQRVVCFETSNSTLVTRKDNKVAFHGNSKHASHAVRLLTMGLEALKYKTLFPTRTGIDANVLLNIKQGNMPYEDVMIICHTMFADLDSMYKESTLRHSPDVNAINELCIELVQKF